MASKGEAKAPPKISETTKDMTMRFLPHVGIYKEAQNPKKN